MSTNDIDECNIIRTVVSWVYRTQFCTDPFELFVKPKLRFGLKSSNGSVQPKNTFQWSIKHWDSLTWSTTPYWIFIVVKSNELQFEFLHLILMSQNQKLSWLFMKHSTNLNTSLCIERSCGNTSWHLTLLRYFSPWIWISPPNGTERHLHDSLLRNARLLLCLSLQNAQHDLSYPHYLLTLPMQDILIELSPVQTEKERVVGFKVTEDSMNVKQFTTLHQLSKQNIMLRQGTLHVVVSIVMLLRLSLIIPLILLRQSIALSQQNQRNDQWKHYKQFLLEISTNFTKFFDERLTIFSSPTLRRVSEASIYISTSSWIVRTTSIITFVGGFMASWTAKRQRHFFKVTSTEHSSFALEVRGSRNLIGVATGCLTISYVDSNGVVKHSLFENLSDGKMVLQGEKIGFDSIPEMIKYYQAQQYLRT